MRRPAGAVEAGITLVEMMTVVAIIGLIAAISFPAISAGLDSIRLASACDSVAAFLNSGLNRAERRQVPVEIIISLAENSVTMRSAEPGFTRTVVMPDTVSITQLYPPHPSGAEEKSRTLVVYPAGVIPRVGIELANKRGSRRIVRIDPKTGVPQIEIPRQVTP